MMTDPAPAHDAVETRRKRRKLSSGSAAEVATPEQILPTEDNVKSTVEDRSKSIMDLKTQIQREEQVGITQFINPVNLEFFGLLKQRYTDFLVNEIAPDGEVIHLRSIVLPNDTSSPTSKAPEDATNPVQELEQPTNTLKDLQEAAGSGTNIEQHPKTTQVGDSVVNVENAPNLDLSPDDILLLDSYLGSSVRESVVNMWEKAQQKPNAKSAHFGSVCSQPIEDKETRTQVHKLVRRIFEGMFETEALAWGKIRFTIAPRKKAKNARNPDYGRSKGDRRGEQRGKLGWEELGGEYLHFTLYKENKDTMEILSYLASRLKIRPKSFSFAGTKDRRGVAVQRVSVYRIRAERLAAVNATLHSAMVGDFKYEKHGLQLGHLSGNEFLITLRDCHFGAKGPAKRLQATMGNAIAHLQGQGFINYYGLQRFGTRGVRTDEIGKLILKGDFKAAVEAILDFSDVALSAVDNENVVSSDGKPLARDDIARAHALHLFKTTRKAQPALEKLPKKFNAEISVIKHLSSHSNDYIGALSQISRNLRLMYVHAYQSLVWNKAASERWAHSGSQVTKGDLVLVDGNYAQEDPAAKSEVDQNGEVVVEPSSDDIAITQEEMFQRARPLSGVEALSGHYTIFDVVLPTPGFDINYPENDIGNFYKTFMESEEGGKLDPSDMRRPQKDFSLSGSYRKFLARVGNDVSFQIKAYTDPKEALVETDGDRLANAQKAQSIPGDEAPHKRNQAAPQKKCLISSDHNEWSSPPGTLAAAAAERAIGSPAEICYCSEHRGVIRNSPVGTPKEDKATLTPDEMDETAIITEDESSDASVVKGRSDAGMKIDPAANETFTTTTGEIPSPKPAASETFTTTTGEIPETPSLKRPAEATLGDETSGRMKTAIIVKFQLGSSQYATMALRELLKGGVLEYKPEYGGAR